MPSGDAQRVWFPEMLEELVSIWSEAMTWKELADFCQRMTEVREAIRRTRGIRPPRFRCRRCGSVSRSDLRGVSIRSALFALKKQGVVTEAAFKELDRSWKKHRASHELDPYGREAERSRPVPEGEAPSC